MRRQLKSFLITSVLYLTLGTLVIYGANDTSFSDEERPDKSAGRVCFSVISKEAPQKNEAVKKQKKVEKKVKEVKKKPPKKKLHKKVEKKVEKPRPQKVLPEAPAVVPPKEIVEEVTEEPVELEEVAIAEEVEGETVETSAPQSERAATQNVQSAAESERRQARRDRFMALLNERINSNKHYPKSARRRGIEGKVELVFEVCSDGKVDNITVVSGRSIFKRSAIQAIVKSFPIEVDEALFEFPHEFRVTLEYVLK